MSYFHCLFGGLGDEGGERERRKRGLGGERAIEIGREIEFLILTKSLVNRCYS